LRSSLYGRSHLFSTMPPNLKKVDLAAALYCEEGGAAVPNVMQVCRDAD